MRPEDPYRRPTPPAPAHAAAPSSGWSAPQAPSSFEQSPPPASTPRQPHPQAPVSPIPQPGTPPSGQYPVDYLNTIAAPQPVKTLPKFAIFGMIGGVIALAIFAVFILSSAGGPPNFSEQSLAVKGRIATLLTISKEQQSHLTDNNLRDTNATLSLTLTTMDSDLGEIIQAQSTKKTPKTIKPDQSYSTLSSELNDAYLSGTLDRSYASELNYQLSLFKTQLRRLKAQAGKNRSVIEFYDKSMPSIEAVQKQYAEFAGTK